MEMDSLKKIRFFPPASRRFGKGVVGEIVSLAGWHVGWRDSEFKVVVTSVSLSLLSVAESIWLRSVVGRGI
jgi:hypothetical protein